MTLLEEYAFRLLADQSSPIPITASFAVAIDALTFSFPANPAAIDLRYEIQFVNDFEQFPETLEWLPMGDSIIGDTVIQPANGEFEIEGTSSATVPPRVFGRVKIEKP